MAQATASGVRELNAFTTKLRQAVSAVLAARSLLYSQGQTEGQVNRLKLLKRSKYGRATFDLLRGRILYASATSGSWPMLCVGGLLFTNFSEEPSNRVNSNPQPDRRDMAYRPFPAKSAIVR